MAKKHYLLLFAKIGVFIFSLFVLINSVKTHYSFINYPYQHEYREGAALAITQLYLENKNPYKMEYQPQNTYVYGFLYPRIVSILANFFGNTLSLHRWVTYVFFLLSCTVIFFTLIRLKLNPYFAFAAAVILHQSFVNAGVTPIARPEGLGIFLFVLGILIPWHFSFSRFSLLVSIVFGILGYLSKPYYFLVIPLIGLYLILFVSKRKGIGYGLASILAVLIMIVATYSVYEVYHNNTFFHHRNTAVYKFSWMKEQLLQFMEVNTVLLLLILLSAWFIIKKFILVNYKNTVENTVNNFRNKFIINYAHFNKEPLIKCDYNPLFIFVFMWVIFLFIIKLGGHTGNYGGVYLYHLASPFLVLLTFQFIRVFENTYSQIIVALFLIFTLSFQFKVVSYDWNTFSSCYKNIETKISEHQHVLNSPEVVSIMIAQNKPVYNSGLSEYFPTGISKLSLILGASKGVEEREQAYLNDINEKVNRKEFDLMLLTKGFFSYLGDTAILKQNYQCSDTLCAPMFYDKFEVETWYPKK